MHSPDIRLSIVIPSYRGSSILEKQLPLLHTYLRGKAITYELIVVDDGSNDNQATQKVAAANNCIFLENPKNLGKGGAVRNGILAANGAFIIYTDVDVPFEYEAIDRFIHYLDFKEFDIVVGDRTLPGSSYFTEISSLRKVGSIVFTFIVGRFVTTGLFDTQCGMKGFRRVIARELFSVMRVNGFAFDVELLYIALKRNYDIKRLPVRLRCQEESSVSVIRHGLGMVIDLFRVKFNNLKGKYKKKHE